MLPSRTSKQVAGLCGMGLALGVGSVERGTFLFHGRNGKFDYHMISWVLQIEILKPIGQTCRDHLFFSIGESANQLW